MRFIETEDEEELKMLATKSTELKKAVGVLMELSADEQTRMIAEYRENFRRDTVSRLNWARDEGRKEGLEEGRKEGREENQEEVRRETKLEMARKMKDLGLPTESIIAVTGLTAETIDRL